MKKYVVGIDEVGRGPIAGPTTIGIVVMEKTLYTRMQKNELVGIKDSKKLTSKKRNLWEKKIKTLSKEGKLMYTILSGNAQLIDQKGISVVLHALIQKGLKKYSHLNLDILLDGGLHAPKEYKQTTVIKGDSIHQIISMASILAKEYRDRYMHRMDTKYPNYGFISHVGYGTKKHYEMLRKKGTCILHRKSFL